MATGACGGSVDVDFFPLVSVYNQKLRYGVFTSLMFRDGHPC